MKETHSGIVAIIGRPNAGKSTLINQLVAAKVSIVSRKAQTTRMRIMGVLTEDATQIVFIDTPGIFAPKGRFEEAMLKAVKSSMRDADHVLVIVDASRNDCLAKNQEIVEDVKRKNCPFSVVLNKIDLIDKKQLLYLGEQFGVDSLFMISAKNNDGVDTLKSYLLAQMPEGPFLFDEDAVTNLPERLYAAEITREQVFHYLHDELPYQIFVETDKWEELSDGSLKIYQTLYVMQDKHRSMVLGKKGEMIKRISQMSRESLSLALGCKCHLFLHVKVDPKWQERKEFYQQIGLDY